MSEQQFTSVVARCLWRARRAKAAFGRLKGAIGSTQTFLGKLKAELDDLAEDLVEFEAEEAQLKAQQLQRPPGGIEGGELQSTLDPPRGTPQACRTMGIIDELTEQLERERLMGRPRKPDGERKARRFSLRLTNEAWKRLENLAKAAGVTPGQFLRERISDFQEERSEATE